MKAIVVDNEKEIRESVVALINAFCPEITSLLQADSVASGYELIKNNKADIVFLDVELGDGTGMDLLSKFSTIDFPVVFITAHNKYAIDAFRFSAVDFLLKPINPEELIQSVEKVKKQSIARLQEQVTYLREIINNNSIADKKIVLRDSDSIYFVKISEIIRCESEKSYTTFVLSNQKNITVSKGLKDYEELLESYGFVRTHQSHLVNISKIVRFDKTDGSTIIMENNDAVPVSQRKKEQILDLFNNL